MYFIFAWGIAAVHILIRVSVMTGFPLGERDDCICIGNSMICSDNFGINTMSDISKLLYVIS